MSSDVLGRVIGVNAAVVARNGDAHAVIDAANAVFNALKFHRLHAADALARRKVHVAEAVGGEKIAGYLLKLC